MEDKTVTLIISDLHVGGGDEDQGDDHVYDKQQLRNFIDQQTKSTEGQKGDVELIINGDFLEFAQVKSDVYKLGSAKYWCSEAESLLKLKAITTGHADIFEAFKRFQEKRNRLTIAAGNHDVDLYWPEVQKHLREVGGPIDFELGNVWYSRYQNRLRITHGHMFDPANKFERWNDPIIRDAEGGVARLEMCPGTLFMVKFVNWLEENGYPFADNLKPVTALGRILWGESRIGLLTVSWMLMRFAARHPTMVAGIKEMNEEIGKTLVKAIQRDDKFATEVTALYQKVRDSSATVDTVKLNLNNEDALFDFMTELIPLLEPKDWMPVFDKAKLGGTMSIGNPGRTLAIKAGNNVDKQFLWKKAQEQFLLDGAVKVVVMGHTHQPDEQHSQSGGTYYNPGSWTRYVDYEKNPNLTLADLANDKDFNYELNYVRVEQMNDKRLESKQITFDTDAR